jgi:8-oxo-dGTP diphosphatase
MRSLEVKKQAVMTAVLDDEGKVLILRRCTKEKWMPNRWNLPGGSLEHGETPKEGARRECLEETGIPLGELRLCQRIEKPNIILWLFVAEADQQVLLDPRESSDYAWVSLELINNYHFVPGCKEVLTQILGARWG